MIGKLNHVAIVVPDLEAATATYRDTLGASVTAPMDLPEHGVTTVFVELPNTKIELLLPLGANSPIAKFLEKNKVHHALVVNEDGKEVGLISSLDIATEVAKDARAWPWHRQEDGRAHSPQEIAAQLAAH